MSSFLSHMDRYWSRARSLSATLISPDEVSEKAIRSYSRMIRSYSSLPWFASFEETHLRIYSRMSPRSRSLLARAKDVRPTIPAASQDAFTEKVSAKHFAKSHSSFESIELSSLQHLQTFVRLLPKIFPDRWRSGFGENSNATRTFVRCDLKYITLCFFCQAPRLHTFTDFRWKRPKNQGIYKFLLKKTQECDTIIKVRQCSYQRLDFDIKM